MCVQREGGVVNLDRQFPVVQLFAQHVAHPSQEAQALLDTKVQDNQALFLPLQDAHFEQQRLVRVVSHEVNSDAGFPVKCTCIFATLKAVTAEGLVYMLYKPLPPLMLMSPRLPRPLTKIIKYCATS